MENNSFCGYCGNELEIEYRQEEKTSSIITNNGVVVEEIEIESTKKQKAVLCSSCGNLFCPACIESYYKNKDTFVKSNICVKCKQENCSHNYSKQFIRHDNNFDYYEMECTVCGHKKGIAEPIVKIKTKPTPNQNKTTQTRPAPQTRPNPQTKSKPQARPKPQVKSKPQKKGLSKIIDSIKGLFK